MTLTTVRWVLWVSLLVLAPVPVYQQLWGWVPLGHLVQAVAYGALPISLVLLGQLLLWGLILWLAAFLYGKLSLNWPARIRGSIMALTVFSVLIVFSSMPIYQPLLLGDSPRLSFLQLYQP